MNFVEELQNLEAQARNEVDALTDAKALEELKNKFLGRKGAFALLTPRIAQVPPEQKAEAGQALNRVKQALEALFQEKSKSFSTASQGSDASFDSTMPGTFYSAGHLHPLTQVMMDVTTIFKRLGFSVVDGPEAETEYYNFEALNIPLDHPARDGFDTFYLSSGKLLRSQTSPVQIRVMEKTKPPLAIVAPGKVYRPDAVDATHSFMFHQIEGLMVDEGIQFSHLKGVLLSFAKQFFGPEAKLQFRPHFFPFTEPSAEIDVWHPTKGWLEILGAGMVHPRVLKAGKIDPKKYSGFAFGMGVERMAMLKYGVQDIRQFFENDIRFLNQF